MEDGMQEVVKERQPQLLDQGLNLLDLKMDQYGKNSVSRNDLDEWQKTASPEEQAVLQAVEFHFDDVRATNGGDDGGIGGTGILAQNAADITRADVHDTKDRLADLRHDALSQEEINILSGLGSYVSREALQKAKSGADADKQPIFDDLLNQFDTTRNMITADTVTGSVGVTMKGGLVTSARPSNDLNITNQDIQKAQERHDELAWWDRSS